MTLRTEIKDGVALVTLDRPERHNAIDLDTAAELGAAWRAFRFDDAVRAAVVTGAAWPGLLQRPRPLRRRPPAALALLPRRPAAPHRPEGQRPVEAGHRRRRRNGLRRRLLSPGEAEFLIASENSTFFDPHTTYGMVSAYESIYMAQRMPYGEIARLALMGTAERLGAPRAHEIGLVSELTAPGAAAEVALRRAAVLAAQPTEAVQGTVRALWTAKEAARTQALAQAPQLIALGNLPPDRQAGLFATRPRHGGQEGGREDGREDGRDSGPPVR